MHFVVTGHLEGTVYRAQTFPRYLAHLNDQVTPLTEGELSVLGYEDALQMPLQPLMDNLDSGTYEVFERDTIKYDLYEEAIRRALLDRPEDTADSPPTVVMIVGAGRGPLVKRSLRAAETAKRRVRVYAVEKNPFALVTCAAYSQQGAC